MNIFKLAEALGVDTTCKYEEIQYLRENLSCGIDQAREIIIEPRVLEAIKSLVKCIKTKDIRKWVTMINKLMEKIIKMCKSEPNLEIKFPILMRGLNETDDKNRKRIR